MIARSAVQHIEKLLRIFPAVGIVGPRQVGKTTLVRHQLDEVLHDGYEYVDLENPRDRIKLSDPLDYFERRADRCILVDEIQLMPQLFSVLRPIIDADRRPGRFILLGSASPQLIRGASESLAGRIGYTELRPITANEIANDKVLQAKHWIRGGYPQALLLEDTDASELWRINYLESYVTRELPQLGSVGEPAVLRRLLQMIAGAQGDLANHSSFARALGVTQRTVKSYLDLLEQSFLIRQLPGFHVNVKKRLVKAPKLYIRDTGLLHAQLGITSEIQLTASLAVGGSWEGYVIEQLIAIQRPQTTAYFYRTHAGAEVDLVLEGRQGQLACVEIKRSTEPKLTRGFYTAIEDLGPTKTLVVAPVKEAFSLSKGVVAMPLSKALEELADW